MTASPDPPGSGSPEALARRVLVGDADAVDAWYRAEHARVFRLCFGFLADVHDAEDLTQDAMLHLKDRLPHWDERRAYEPWRSAVVLNLCRDRLRRSSARAHAEMRAGGQAPSALPAPEDAARGAEVAEILRRAMAALPAREREAFVLHDLEQMETSVVAAAMQVGESSVRSLLALARRRLRQLLGPQLAAGEGGVRA